MRTKIDQSNVKQFIFGLVLIVTIGMAAAKSASAATVAFVRMSENSPTDIASTLTMNIVDFNGQAFFQITHTAPVGSASFIRQIYVEDQTGAISSFDFSPTLSVGDVDFVSTGAGVNVPSYNTFDTAYSAQPTNPPMKRGISGGESGVFLADYLAFGLVEAALSSGDLRVAMHVQGLGSNGDFSDTFVSLLPVNPAVPEPDSVVLIALTAFVLLSRRHLSRRE